MIEPGRAYPLGATPDEEGVNFALYAGHATGVSLLLFADLNAPEPYQTVRLDPLVHQSFVIWHVYVRGLAPGAVYAYRVDGPNDPASGLRYDADKVLVDPYARGVSAQLWDRAAASRPGDNVATAQRGVVVGLTSYDWEGDHLLHYPMRETIIYELHVGGFTKSPSSGVDAPGTFAGLIEKIPYLRDLGITAVELLPVCAFDPGEIGRLNPVDGTPLTNFWGYSPLHLFSPHPGYCTTRDPAQHLNEFRDMVKAFHRAGIEVILDVVFNHTGEGGQDGPYVSFKGLDNPTYYLLDPHDPSRYLDFSGCKNTMNCNHPVTAKLVTDCLTFWVQEMHVDGFRFDEASILARGEDGLPLLHPPVLWAIELSDALDGAKIIAEAWDAGGLYQIGHFPGYRWAEWNGRFRDDMRRFVRGDGGMIGAVASRLTGSSDLYGGEGKLPLNSVNFITCHDGFTMNDLVSYNEKHNEANGEGNRDGANDNASWNCGVEGPSDDPQVEALRRRQIKSFFALLLLSQGVPMLLAGDEVRRTQRGNNNAYCQDNAVSWFDWTLLERERDLLRFVRGLIAFRKSQPVLHKGRFFTGQMTPRGLPDIAWHGCRLEPPDWNDTDARALACTIAGLDRESDLHIMLNMDVSDLSFDLPAIPERTWYRVIDTAAAPPDDIMEPGAEPPVAAPTYTVTSHSVVVLVAR